MKRSRYSDEQIAYALRQAESGTPVADVCRSSASAKRRSTSGRRSTRTWARPSCGSCGSCATRTRKLKRLVADLTLDKHILGEIVRKKV